MGLFNLGISKIEIADIAPDGGTGTSWATLGDTLEGSCKLNFAEGTVQELKVEEKSTAVDTIEEEGEKVIEFTVADPDEDTLVKVFGGSKSGSAGSTVYKAPQTTVNIEKSLKITPQKGIGFIFTRVSISARFTDAMGKGQWLGVIIKAKVLAPTKSGVSSWETFRKS